MYQSEKVTKIDIIRPNIPSDFNTKLDFFPTKLFAEMWTAANKHVQHIFKFSLLPMLEL